MFPRHLLLIGCVGLGGCDNRQAPGSHSTGKQGSAAQVLPSQTVSCLAKGNDRPAEIERYTVQRTQQSLRVSAQLTSGKEMVKLEIPAETVSTSEVPELGGAAAWNERMIITLTRRQEILIVDLKESKLTARQSLPDFPHPRGVDFDPQGNLWVLSENSLNELQFTSDGHFNPINHRADFDAPQWLCIDRDGKFHLGKAGGQRVHVLSTKLEEVPIQPMPPGQTLAGLFSDKHGRVWAKLDNGELYAPFPP